MEGGDHALVSGKRIVREFMHVGVEGQPLGDQRLDEGVTLDRVQHGDLGVFQRAAGGEEVPLLGGPIGDRHHHGVLGEAVHQRAARTAQAHDDDVRGVRGARGEVERHQRRAGGREFVGGDDDGGTSGVEDAGAGEDVAAQVDEGGAPLAVPILHVVQEEGDVRSVRQVGRDDAVVGDGEVGDGLVDGVAEGRQLEDEGEGVRRSGGDGLLQARVAGETGQQRVEAGGLAPGLLVERRGTALGGADLGEMTGALVRGEAGGIGVAVGVEVRVEAEVGAAGEARAGELGPDGIETRAAVASAFPFIPVHGGPQPAFFTPRRSPA